jgi:hypothetical protein
MFSWIGKTVYLQYVIVRQKSLNTAMDGWPDRAGLGGRSITARAQA